MLGAIAHVLKYWTDRKIDCWNTAMANFSISRKHGFNSLIGHSPFILGKRVNLYLSPSGGINVTNPASLCVGSIWSRTSPFDTVVKVDKQAQISVSGSFHIFSGAFITINENAQLHLGSGYINTFCKLDV